MIVTDLASITLAKGSHDGDCADPQRCLFEWFNWITRHVHTDDCPPGVSPVLHAYGIRLNDILPDDKRQQLRKYLPNGTSPLAGTAGDGKDETRGYIALDWLIRTYLPEWLDLAKLTAEATALRDLRRIADLVAAKAARPAVQAAYDNAYKARTAAWAAEAAGAAWAAEAAGGAWAAEAAGGAEAALKPTVDQLQQSAIDLYDVLIAGEWPAA